MVYACSECKRIYMDKMYHAFLVLNADSQKAVILHVVHAVNASCYKHGHKSTMYYWHFLQIPKKKSFWMVCVTGRTKRVSASHRDLGNTVT